MNPFLEDTHSTVCLEEAPVAGSCRWECAACWPRPPSPHPPLPPDLSLICYSNCPWYCSLSLKGKADLLGRGHLRTEPSVAVQEEVPDNGLQKAKLLFFPSPKWLPFFSSLSFYVWASQRAMPTAPVTCINLGFLRVIVSYEWYHCGHRAHFSKCFPICHLIWVSYPLWELGKLELSPAFWRWRGYYIFFLLKI